MGLGNAGERKVGVYSLGMRQRLGVAAALLTKPEVLILDEPASGMDPLSLHSVHGVLREVAREKTAVLLSTHHLDEVVTYCSRVAILEEGVLIDEVNLLHRRDRYRVRVNNIREARVALQTQPFVSGVETRGQDLIFVLDDPKALGRVPEVLSGAGLELFEMSGDAFNLRAYYRERLARQRAAQPDAVCRGSASPDPSLDSGDEDG